jgi:protein-tyrosine phosphatase
VAQAHKTILFLCTGNYYRSRFAEVLFVSLARKTGLRWNASSRALALERGAGNVGPMATAAVQALAAMGHHDAERCTRSPAQVTAADFKGADLIIALKRTEHLPLLQERFPEFADRVEFWHVEDAPGVLPEITAQIEDLVGRFLGADGEVP